MKRHFYILTSLLILFTGLISLEVYSSWRYSNKMAPQDIKHLLIQPFSSDQSVTAEAATEDLLDLLFDSEKTYLPEELPGQKSKPPQVSFLQVRTLNPLVFDLPPPVPFT